MANEEHLKIIKEAIEKKDIKIWNEWRLNNPHFRPDLSGAVLQGANLQQARFWRANLRGANLENARLSGADLWQADLSGAVLQRANLKQATLWQADLSGAVLQRANLKQANLSKADLSKADLSKADLSKARGLSPFRIKSASEWEKAFYDPEMLKSLGLPPDHNDRLKKVLEEEHTEK